MFNNIYKQKSSFILEMKKRYHFFKQTENIDEVMKASYDPMKTWCQDKKGYFLIRINRKKKQIEVAFVTNDHVMLKKIYGMSAAALYHTIIQKKLLTRLEHAAYLGKELYKAELALKYDLPYQQDFPLRFPMKETVRLRQES